MVLERNTISNYLLRASRGCSLTIVRLVFRALIQVHHSLAYLKAQSMASFGSDACEDLNFPVYSVLAI